MLFSTMIKRRDASQVKFQALREVLPKHRWILYVDCDTLFLNLSKPLSVEAMLATWPRHVAVVAPASGSGFWNTDSVLVRNSVFGRHFLQRIWDLWSVCRNCAQSADGEQCFMNVALYETFLSHMRQLARRGAIPGQVLVERFHEQYSCCHLQQLCTQRSPRIAGSPMRQIYMCMRKWNDVFATTEDTRLAQADRMHAVALGDLRRDLLHRGEAFRNHTEGRFEHPHVRRFDYRHHLGIRHPMKDIPPENCAAQP